VEFSCITIFFKPADVHAAMDHSSKMLMQLNSTILLFKYSKTSKMTGCGAGQKTIIFKLILCSYRKTAIL
jgi:hypothetical protein